MKTFNDYWRSLTPAQKAALAAKASTPVNYLAQVSGGHRNAGASLMARLCKADRKITPSMLRPDLYD